jgi:hypothetical protein
VKSKRKANSIYNTIDPGFMPKEGESISEEFADFANCKGNSWQIEGMESMTSDEFYKAINKRNKAIKDKRYQYSPREPVSDYLSSLSKGSSKT